MLSSVKTSASSRPGSARSPHADDASSSSPISPSAQTHPAWMKALYASAERWLTVLPEQTVPFPARADSTREPLSRFWHREHNLAETLLATVRHDLAELLRMGRGETKQTNHSRMLMTVLAKAVVPDHWRQYTVPKRYTVEDWVVDFHRRLTQLERVILADLADGEKVNKQEPAHAPVWLGGLFFSTRFITATRQAAAQRRGKSLEESELVLDLDGAEAAKSDPEAFVLSGLHFEGAAWKNQRIELSNELSTELADVALRWTTSSASREDANTSILIPVYLNSDRADLLFSAHLTGDPADHVLIVQRGVALIAGA